MLLIRVVDLRFEMLSKTNEGIFRFGVWEPDPVLIFLLYQPDGCAIGAIVKLKFYIGVQEELVRNKKHKQSYKKGKLTI